MSLSRRHFLRTASAAALATLAADRLAGQGGTQQPPSADRLQDPTIAGRPRDAFDPLDNDPTIIGIERNLRCTCGCTLDIYVCRTTDFSCTYSPALHREIKAMHVAGKTPQEIVDVLVAREGPQMLMAPPPQGFNLAGYLLPGLSVAVAGTLLAAWLLRKRTAAPAGAMAAGPATPVVSAADAERLRRALDEVES